MEFQGRKHLIDNVVSKNNCKRSKKNESVLKKNTKQFSEATHDLSLNDIDDGFTSIRYACHICSKSLSRKNDLKRHVMFTPESANFPAPFAQLDLCPRAILTSMWGVTLARSLTSVIFSDAQNRLPSKVTWTSTDAYILKTKGSNVNNANTDAYRAQIWRTTCWSTWILSLSSAEYVQKHSVKRTSWKNTSKGSTCVNQ